MNDVAFINNSAGNVAGALTNGDYGFINLNNVSFQGNDASYGGAIFNWGSIVIRDVDFVNNSANVSGGAICNNAIMGLCCVSFLNNRAYCGGAISNYKVSVLRDAVFKDNTAFKGGGSIFNRGELNVSNAFFSSRISDDWCQIICNMSDVFIDNSTFLNLTSSYSPVLFDSHGNVSYACRFEAIDDDLIAAVGTYFNNSNANYNVEIYVNGDLKLSQDGASPFAGFHTIKLNEYVPVKAGDDFCAVISSNAMPFIGFNETMMHYSSGLTYRVENGNWIDLYDEGKTACLKVFTVADDSRIIDVEDISVDYAGGKCFSVRVVTADGHAVVGANVTFTINKRTVTVPTDKGGIAKIRITDVPGKYAIKTAYNGKTYSNRVTVYHVLKATKCTVKKTAKKFALKATLKINGKAFKGKWIKFKLNCKTYKVKTNSKGIAQKTLDKNVIKKLKKGKTYTVKVTYTKDTIKTTLKVK